MRGFPLNSLPFRRLLIAILVWAGAWRKKLEARGPFYPDTCIPGANVVIGCPRRVGMDVDTLAGASRTGAVFGDRAEVVTREKSAHGGGG